MAVSGWMHRRVSRSWRGWWNRASPFRLCDQHHRELRRTVQAKLSQPHRHVQPIANIQIATSPIRWTGSHRNNLFLPPPPAANPIVVKPGIRARAASHKHLEGLTVAAVEEMINMITTQRNYELNSKIVNQRTSAAETEPASLENVMNPHLSLALLFATAPRFIPPAAPNSPRGERGSFPSARVPGARSCQLTGTHLAAACQLRQAVLGGAITDRAPAGEALRAGCLGWGRVRLRLGRPSASPPGGARRRRLQPALAVRGSRDQSRPYGRLCHLPVLLAAREACPRGTVLEARTSPAQRWPTVNR